MAVDHSQYTNVAVTSEGEILTYQNPAVPLSCVDKYGNNRLKEINKMDGNISDPTTYFQGYTDDWLLLNFGRVTAAEANLILRDDWKCDMICIKVQVPDECGNWQTVAVLYPRNSWAMEAVNLTRYVPANGDFWVRLLWTAPHRLDFVGLDSSEHTQLTVSAASPTLAVHSIIGDVTAILLFDDENCVEITTGEQVALVFTLPTKAPDTAREFILYTNGYYYVVKS